MGARCPPQMPGFLPPSRQPWRRLLHLPPPPCSHGKGEEDPLTARVHGDDAFALGLSFNTEAPVAFKILRSSDLTHHLGVRRQSSASSVSSGARSPSAVPSPPGLSPLAVEASGLRGAGESGEQEEAGRTRVPPGLGAPVWLPSHPNQRQKSRAGGAWSHAPPTTPAQQLGSPKGVWTTGRQGGGSAGSQLLWAARPRPASESGDPPPDPPFCQRREPEAPARAPATGS